MKLLPRLVGLCALSLSTAVTAAPVINSVHLEYSSSGVPIAMRIVGAHLCSDVSCAKKPEVKIADIVLSDLTTVSDVEVRVGISAVRDGNYVLSVSTGVESAIFPLKIQTRILEPTPSIDAPKFGLGKRVDFSNQAVAPADSKIQSVAASLVPPTEAVNFFRKSKPPYPIESRKLQEEGSVIVEIKIANSGWASCRIVESSGTKRIDDATVEWCATKKFDPATREGVPEDFTFKLKYTFQLRFNCSAEMVKKANEGDASSQFDLAECFIFGWNEEKSNVIEAEKWYRLAAEKGHSMSQRKLGLIYFWGTGVETDYRESMKWLRRSANQNDPIAQGMIGVMYEKGLGVEKDYSEAAKWFRLASLQSFEGSSKVQFQLGKLYRDGKGVKQDYLEAERLFQLASSTLPAAKSELGYLYTQGLGVKKDYPEAARLFRLAADAGDSSAKVRLGALYVDGHGVKIDRNEAIRLVREAAEQNDPSGQVALASYYIKGIGVKKDNAEAVKWLIKAAKQKFYPAIAALGDLYSSGFGLGRNYVQAYVWLSLASDGDFSSGIYKNKLTKIARKMTVFEMIEAQKLIKNCIDSEYAECF